LGGTNGASLNLKYWRLQQAIEWAKAIMVTRLLIGSRRKIQDEKLFMKNTTNLHKAGFTLVEIMVVIAVIGLLAAIAIPNFFKARATSQANACIKNMQKIDAAAQEFALETRKKNYDSISFPTDLTPYIKLNAQSSIPPCPAGGSYTCDAVGNAPTCTLSDTIAPSHNLP
jgi:prepilin-type N-terminal cleavage/methylation domain-containing protein